MQLPFPGFFLLDLLADLIYLLRDPPKQSASLGAVNQFFAVVLDAVLVRVFQYPTLALAEDELGLSILPEMRQFVNPVGGDDADLAEDVDAV